MRFQSEVSAMIYAEYLEDEEIKSLTGTLDHEDTDEVHIKSKGIIHVIKKCNILKFDNKVQFG